MQNVPSFFSFLDRSETTTNSNSLDSESVSFIEWNFEWSRILRKSLDLQKKGELFSKWFYPVYNFIFFDLMKIYEKNVNIVSLAPFDFVSNAIEWLSNPIIKKTSLLDESVISNYKQNENENENKKAKIQVCKKMFFLICFYQFFCYGAVDDPEIFKKIGDDDLHLIVIASAWPIHLKDNFLFISFPSLSYEKTLFLKTYIWYFLNLYYKNNPQLIVPSFVLEKFPGILFDKLPIF